MVFVPAPPGAGVGPRHLAESALVSGSRYFVYIRYTQYKRYIRPCQEGRTKKFPTLGREEWQGFRPCRGRCFLQSTHPAGWGLRRVTFSLARESNQRARLGGCLRMEQAPRTGQLHSRPPPKNPLFTGAGRSGLWANTLPARRLYGRGDPYFRCRSMCGH